MNRGGYKVTQEALRRLRQVGSYAYESHVARIRTPSHRDLETIEPADIPR